MLRAAKILFIIFSLGTISPIRAQLLTNLGEYRNQLFVNSGYYLSFANYSFGWIHSERVKFLHRDCASILDVSLPLQQNGYTRFVFRKGVQANIYQSKSFRLPFAVIGSSDKQITHIFRIHNFVTDFFLNPGIYKERFTLAMEMDYKVIWFSHYHKTNSGTVPSNTATPGDPGAIAPNQAKIRSKAALGIAVGLNYKRITWLIRTGYQQTADIAQTPYAFYAVLQIGYNCNFRKKKEEAPSSN